MAVMAAMFRWAWDGVFGGIDAFFRAPPVVPELSASFRALTPVSARGLLPIRPLCRVDKHIASSLTCVRNNHNNHNNPEKTQHTLQVLMFNLDHVCGKDCIQLIFSVILFLVTRGGAVPRITRGHSCSGKDRGGLIPWVCLPTSPGLHVLKLAVCSGVCAR